MPRRYAVEHRAGLEVGADRDDLVGSGAAGIGEVPGRRRRLEWHRSRHALDSGQSERMIQAWFEQMLNRASAFFMGWTLIGAGYTLAFVGMFTIGPLLLLPIVAGAVALGRLPHSARGLPGLATGLGLPVLYVAYLSGGDPRWLTIGTTLVASGVVTFLIKQRRTHGQQLSRLRVRDVRACALVLTLWLARTLYTNGAVFLEEVFDRKEIAVAVNRLLVTGFFMINLGYAMFLFRNSEVDTRPKRSKCSCRSSACCCFPWPRCTS